MRIRPKTIRRLLILFCIALVFVGALTTWLLISQHRVRGQIAQLRTQAIAAYNAKDFANAAHLFSDYLTRSHAQDTDIEAIYDFAQSRLATPMDGNRQIYEAISLFERYLQMEPSDTRDASHTLLTLYVQARYNKEGLTLAQRLLAANPKDVAALHGEIQTLRGDQNFAAALQACQKLNAISPDDLEWQITELDLMAKSGKPAAEVLALAKELRDAHPNQSTFAALWAVALLNAHDEANANTAIHEAAKLPPGKPENVLQLVRMLDLTRSFDLSDDLLNRAYTADPKSPRLTRLLVQRTFERAGAPAVIERFKTLDTKTADSTAIGYAAFADFQTNHPTEGRLLLTALASRNDAAAKAWTTILQTSTAKEAPAPADAIKQYASAARNDPTNAIAYLLLGQTYAAMGETDAAIRYWTSAAEVSPAWALPHGLISRTQSAVGQYGDALRSAEACRERAPGTQLAETSYAVAWYGLSVREAVSDTDDAKALSQQLEMIQRTWPNDPATLPLYVANLARHGNADQAVSVISAAIRAKPTPGLSTLLQLAQVSRQQMLHQETAILNAAELAYGPQPTIASARAVTEPTAKMLATFDDGAAGHAKDPAWQLAGARLADSLGDASALSRWKSLGDAQPRNLAIQSAILESPSRRLDNEFWRRTIDRLKSIEGADRQLVELEDVRLRLNGPLNDADLDSLIGTLQRLSSNPPEDAATHRLLAQVYLRSSMPDHLSRAAGELQRAHDLRPADFETTAELVQILIGQGQRSRATTLVDALTHEYRLTTAQRLWAADAEGQLGQPKTGIALLTTLSADPQSATLLARLYQEAGQSDKAADLYRKLLADPNAPVDALTGGAEFFARAHQADTANQFADRIEKFPLQPGAAPMIRARVDQLLGNLPDAAKLLTAATIATPTVEQLWQELAGVQLRGGHIDDAQRTVAQGIAANTKSTSLKAMQANLARVRTLPPETVAPLLDVLCHQPALPVLDQTLKILTSGNNADVTTASLRGLANQQPQFVPLQEMLAARYAAVGDTKDAAEMASRAASVAVNDPAPLRLLCAIQTAAGDWDAVRQAAVRWRALTPTDTFDPDMSIARAYLNQIRPDPDAAARQIAVYATTKTPDARQDQALPLYASALIAGGKSADAEALLKPRLTDSRWRMIWLELAGTVQKDRATAAQWIQTAAAMIPPENTEEKVAVADAWERIGSRFNSFEAHGSAMDILRPIVEAPSASAAAWASWATVNQSTGNLAEAEHGWRQFLASRTNEPLAKNNLAYTLLLQGGDARLLEAEKLCQEAIAQAPAISGFYDTLARVELAQGNTADAQKNFRTSLSRDPNNIEAMIGLADLLQTDSKSRDELKNLLIRIDAGIRSGTSLTPPIKQQLDRVKSALTSSI